VNWVDDEVEFALAYNTNGNQQRLDAIEQNRIERAVGGREDENSKSSLASLNKGGDGAASARRGNSEHA